MESLLLKERLKERIRNNNNLIKNYERSKKSICKLKTENKVLLKVIDDIDEIYCEENKEIVENLEDFFNFLKKGEE